MTLRLEWENLFCREVQGRLESRVTGGYARGRGLKRRESCRLGVIRALMETFLISKTHITNPENLFLLMQDTIFLILDELSPLLTGLNKFFLKSWFLAFPCLLVLLIFLLAPQFLFHDVGQKTDFLTQDFHGDVLFDHFLPTKNSPASLPTYALHIHLSTPSGLAWHSSHFLGRCTAWTLQVIKPPRASLASKRKGNLVMNNSPGLSEMSRFRQLSS